MRLHSGCFILNERRAFTLIELLVVIAIISMLFSFILPSLANARKVAYRAEHMSNLKQLQAAWLMFAHEHDGCTLTFKVGHTPDAWAFQLYPYYMDQNIVESRFMESPNGDQIPKCVIREYIKTGDTLNTDPGHSYMVSLASMAVYPAYGYNEHGWTPHYTPDGSSVPQAKRKGLKLNECLDPSGTMVFGTSIGMSGAGLCPNCGWYRLTPYRKLEYPNPGAILWAGAPPLTQNSYGGLSPHWFKRACISFADGHVEVLDPAKLTDVKIWDPRRK